MTESNLRPPHILIVDDSRHIQEFLKHSVLEPEGYRVSNAYDGVEGLALAREELPDLILLDYEMPRMNGIQVLQHLQKLKLKIPVILITSYGSESVAVDVFRLGVRDYIPKPFSIEEILAAIDEVLHLTRLQQERDALFKQLQVTNAQLLQRVRELDILYHVSKSVTTLRKREKLLERIIDAALYLTGAQDGMVVLLNPETGTPAFQVRRERCERACQTPDAELNLRTTSTGLMLSVPLRFGEIVSGALMVSNKRNRQPLNKQDRRLLRMLADYAAIAIENFRLVEKMEARQQRAQDRLYDMLRHYVSPNVVEQILSQSRSAQPGGRSATISVLIADLREFIRFSDGVPADALFNVLNRHITEAVVALLDEEGTIDRFTGDEVLAYFNAPKEQKDHALRAVRAAHAILERVQQMHDQLPVQQRLAFGIGIATGPAAVGNVGTPELVNYTAIGPTVSKAHRLQESAPPGKIIICYRTYEQVRDAVEAQPLPPVRVKGQQHPEPIYEVQRLK